MSENQAPGFENLVEFWAPGLPHMYCPRGCCDGAGAPGRPVPGGSGVAAQFPWRAEVKQVP